MGRSYSRDLRECVVAFIEAEHSRRAAARHFDVSDSFSIKLMQRMLKLNSILPGRQGRPPGKGKPDITMPELSAKLEAKHGICAQPASLSRFLCRRGFTYKKALMASECAHVDVRTQRRLWRDRRQPRMQLEPHRLVFVDETPVNT